MTPSLLLERPVRFRCRMTWAVVALLGSVGPRTLVAQTPIAIRAARLLDVQSGTLRTGREPFPAVDLPSSVDWRCARLHHRRIGACACPPCRSNMINSAP